MNKAEYYALLVGASKTGLFPSMKSRYSGECAYRNDEGKKCAVGVIIPDGVYDESMEGSSVEGLIRNGVVTENMLMSWSGCSVRELVLCQIVHDDLSEKWDHDHFVERIGVVLGIEGSEQ